MNGTDFADRLLQRAELTRDRLEAELAEQPPVEAPPPRPWKAPARAAQAPFNAHEPPPPPLPTPARTPVWRAPASPPKGAGRGTWIAVQTGKPGEETCLRWVWLPASNNRELAEGVVKLLDLRDQDVDAAQHVIDGLRHRHANSEQRLAALEARLAEAKAK